VGLLLAVAVVILDVVVGVRFGCGEQSVVVSWVMGWLVVLWGQSVGVGRWSVVFW
jgi:hypothetical protein